MPTIKTCCEVSHNDSCSQFTEKDVIKNINLILNDFIADDQNAFVSVQYNIVIFDVVFPNLG